MARKQFTFIAIASIAALCASPVKADLLSFDLTFGNSNAVGTFTGPYAQVDVNLTSATTATITFTSLTNGGNIYLFGDGGSAAVNVNATSWTIGGFTADTLGGFSAPILSDGGAGTEDGFGSFNQTVNNFDGFSHATDMLSFTLTDTSGTWGSASAVLTGNSDGFLAAAHIFVTANPPVLANGASCTGFAAGFPGSGANPNPGTATNCGASSGGGGGGGGGGVPEPATLALFGVGLFGLAFVRRRQR